MISCLMPTYNKVPRSQWLLEEAIESYYRNRDQLPAETDAELIICNDTPGQTLQLADPRPDVRIFNLAHRFDTLGDKLNWMTTQARGTLICRWDDDDISLPWGLRLRYEAMRDENLAYLCFSRFYATDGDKTSVGFGSYAQCIYTKDAAAKVGGYVHTSFGEDSDIENRMHKAFPGRVRRRTPEKSEQTFYIYRWGTGSEHLSGYGRNGHGWEKIGRRHVQTGTFQLNPHWREDYIERCEKARREYDGRQAAAATNQA